VGMRMKRLGAERTDSRKRSKRGGRRPVPGKCRRAVRRRAQPQQVEPSRPMLARPAIEGQSRDARQGFTWATAGPRSRWKRRARPGRAQTVVRAARAERKTTAIEEPGRHRGRAIAGESSPGDFRRGRMQPGVCSGAAWGSRLVAQHAGAPAGCRRGGRRAGAPPARRIGFTGEGSRAPRYDGAAAAAGWRIARASTAPWGGPWRRGGAVAQWRRQGGFPRRRRGAAASGMAACAHAEPTG